MKNRVHPGLSAILFMLLAASLTACGGIIVQSLFFIKRVSVATAGTEANSDSNNTSINSDGRYVAFRSFASNLVAGDANAQSDIFVHDRLAGATVRVSIDSFGAEATSGSNNPSISSDGRYVAFQSGASNLVAVDTNGFDDIFVRDTQTSSTTRVSVDSGAVQANNVSYDPSISANGRYVAFRSSASNLVAVDTNGLDDIFVHDTQTNTTTLVSVDSAGAQANGSSNNPSISSDGRYVVFQSGASNLVAGDTNGFNDIFIRDTLSDTTTLVSINSAAVLANSNSSNPLISSDGQYVAFESSASNLVNGDTLGFDDIFLVLKR